MEETKFPIGLTFDDVLLEPRRSSVVRNRLELETKLTKKIKLDLPIVAAAMDTVSEAEMGIALGKLGGLAILHRNNTTDQQVKMVKKAKSKKVLTGAAVGPLDLERAKALDKAGCDVISVDCAHAHNTRIMEGIKKIRQAVKAQLVVGNIGTAQAAKDLLKYADALKVGIGPGSICTTRIVAGIGVPQLSAILDVVKEAKGRIPVIADGGMKYSGDVVKALAAGASSVMLGGMLAGTKESPGKIITVKGKKYKSYRGMGSFGALASGKSADRYFQKGTKKPVPEGIEGITPYKGKLEDVIYQITGGIKSGMGYIGAHTIIEMPKQAKFIRITNAGLKESHPHSITINKKSPNY